MIIVNNYPVNKEKRYVLYWMQEAQRVHYNQALTLAIHTANKHQLPLVVLFILNPAYKDANLRHYQFMLEGIFKLKQAFKDLNITFLIEVNTFNEALTPYLKDAAAFVMDKSYLRFMRQEKMHLAKEADKEKLLTLMVETEVIVPVEKASPKLEYSARTIRPKLLRLVHTYLEDDSLKKVNHAIDLSTQFMQESIDDLIQRINPSNIAQPTTYFIGGYDEALKRLDVFLDTNLKDYGENDPSKARISTLSPYLHFGQISPMEVYHRIDAYQDTYPSKVEAYLEQLLVRRELAFNYVTYQEWYDQFDTMSDAWAYQTMTIHAEDEREFIYTIDDYLSFNTHDPYFNAAMKEMVKTGFMHNYMRMYWGKKIIEWSHSYKEAYYTIKTLNDRLFYDGRDPNSYASIAWLFGKHDRAWTERAIFGKLRYMNANGLKRKFDIETYVNQMNQLK